MTTTPGFALLIELSMPGTPAAPEVMASLGEMLLSSRPALEVQRLAPELPAIPSPDCAEVKRHVDTFAERGGEVGIMVVSAGLAETLDGPALVAGPHWREYPRESTVPLAWLGERLEAARTSSLVIALALASGRTESSEPNWPELMRALAISRPDCIVAIHDHSLLAVLAAGLSGAALDMKTGTITLRSLGLYLDRRAQGAALRVAERAHTVLIPPSRLHALSWFELATTPPGGNDGTRELEGRILPGRFHIERELARGNFGTVYHARQLIVNRDVAIKVLHQAGAPGSDDRRMFLREIEAVGRIDHPHIVRIYQADVTPDGRLFYAMELVRGRDLQSLMDAGETFSQERAIILICQILLALTEAHAAGVIHADIKPANIMLVPADGASGREERALLLDFGLARLKPAVDVPRVADPAMDDDRSVGGTPAFMAPEQWYHGRVDARSDIFAVGLVVIRMLTGWQRQSKRDLVPPLDRLADERLRAVLGRALAENPSERFDSARAFADALQRRPASREAPRLQAPPFHHLAPLGEGDVFFGRDHAVVSLTEQVMFGPAVIYTAPSGTGKSSLLCAGLVPHLRELGARVIYLACRPGAAMAIIDALSGDPRDARPQPAPAEPEQLARAVAQALTRALDRMHADSQDGGTRRLVLILDQVEALFLDAATPDERHALFETLLHRTRSSNHGGAFSLLLAIREDFLARLLEPSLTVPILRLGPLGRDEARAALTGPLALARIQIEEALVERLLDDLAAAGAELVAPLGWTLAPGQSAIYPPHLQLIGSVLYERLAKDEPALTMAHYQRTGGLDTVLAEHLDRVLDHEIDPEARAAARALFLELVSSAQTRVSRAEADLLAAVEVVYPAERVRRVLDVLRMRGLVVPVSLHHGTRGWELVHDRLIPRVLAWADRHDLGRRQAQEVLHHHLRRSTRKQPSVLGRGELRELARHPEAVTTLERELAARWQGKQGQTPWSPWTPRSLVARSRRVWLGRTAMLAAFTLLALTVATTAVSSWLDERAQREAERRQREGEKQREQSLRDRDLGRFSLKLEPFDWDPSRDPSRGQPLMVPASELPELSWQLFEPSIEDPREPGNPVDPQRVVRGRSRLMGAARVYDVEARGGPAFLKITGRGPVGNRCSPAWVRLQSLPGYVERTQETPEILVRVPTCESVIEGMREVPGGLFVNGGLGVPEPWPDNMKAMRKKEILFLPDFWIDSNEASILAFETYIAMLQDMKQPLLMDYTPVANYDTDSHPIARIDWYTARDYCRFLGKDLPTSAQWEKAARGGIMVYSRENPANPYPRESRANPYPHRNLPWGLPATFEGRANVASGIMVPGDSLIEGASPYNVLHMAGNVYEWTRTTSKKFGRVIRGGSSDKELSPREGDFHFIGRRNFRDAGFRSGDTGMRCALALPSSMDDGLMVFRARRVEAPWIWIIDPPARWPIEWPAP